MMSGVPGTWCASGLPRKADERILDDYELSLEHIAGMCALRWIRLIPQASQAAIATCLALRIAWGTCCKYRCPLWSSWVRIPAKASGTLILRKFLSQVLSRGPCFERCSVRMYWMSQIHTEGHFCDLLWRRLWTKSGLVLLCSHQLRSLWQVRSSLQTAIFQAIKWRVAKMILPDSPIFEYHFYSLNLLLQETSKHKATTLV